MEIVPLGVGEAFAKTLFQTNFLVRPAEGEPFLVDFGHTAPLALERLGIGMASVARVLLSHLHGDHIGGLEELGFTGYFRGGARPSLFVAPDLVPLLWENALSGGMGQTLRDAGGRPFGARLETYFDVHPMPAGEVLRLGSVEVRPFPTPHIPGRPSWGFRLEDRATGTAALLTCDSRFDPASLDRHGEGAAAIFHDCQLTSHGIPIHATLDELLTLPAETQRRILLVHYADGWEAFAGRTGSLRFASQGESYRF